MQYVAELQLQEHAVFLVSGLKSGLGNIGLLINVAKRITEIDCMGLFKFIIS